MWTFGQPPLPPYCPRGLCMTPKPIYLNGRQGGGRGQNSQKMGDVIYGLARHDSVVATCSYIIILFYFLKNQMTLIEIYLKRQ